VDTAIVWLRRDLRITDNTALAAAVERAVNVVPVYVLSDWMESHRWTGPHRQHFLCGCLASLDRNLAAIGGRLIIRRGLAIEELSKLVRETRAQAIFFNRDPDPFGRKVEADLAAFGSQTGLEITGFKDVSLHDPGEILTVSGDPFRVFSPYARAWRQLKKTSSKSAVRHLKTVENVPSLPLPALETWGISGDAHVLPAGEKAARARMKSFLKSGLANYGAGRNILAKSLTSRLSQDLRFGLLSIRELFENCQERAAKLSASGRKSAQKFISELIWREFYLSILWHFPEVLDVEFNDKSRRMDWPGQPEHFERWRAGETGFPIVDAAMRQLKQTGYMPNRARMIVAMFLTKDLLIDWRLGESYFMQELTDGEIASNNGGWQWSAGIGADAAPYFRMLNPWTQTLRFDPQGEYIKAWIPDLQDVPADQLTKPPAPGQKLVQNYPPPIIDHAEARKKVLELFSQNRTSVS
jgi:deoxyribodipyrimidine photo-lyase